MPPHLAANGELLASLSSSQHLHPALSWLLHPHAADSSQSHHMGWRQPQGTWALQTNEWITLLYWQSLIIPTADVILVTYEEIQENPNRFHKLLPSQQAATWHRVASTSATVPPQDSNAVQISKAGNRCKEEGCCLSKCTQVIHFDKCSLVLIIDNFSEQSIFG